MKSFLIGLLYENGAPSRTGLVGLLMVIIPLMVWAFLTVWLAFTGRTFPYYDSMTIGVFGSSAGGGVVAAANKYIISKLNCSQGDAPTKGTAGP